MLCVHPHDAGVVNHLAENQDRVRSLHDPVQIIVEIVRQRGWAGCRTESEQTAFAQRPLLRIVMCTRRLRRTILALMSSGGRRRPRRLDSLARALYVPDHPADRR